MDKKSRIFGLDVLRAIAILIVIFSHSYGYSHIPFFPFLFKILPDGVGLFFVLSGFLIGGILLRIIHKDSFTFKHLTNFWTRRWLRTIPAYYVVITTLFILQFFMNQQNSITEYVQYYFFVQSVKDGTALLYSESWSLCIEEWFYLLIPFALFCSMYFLPLNKRKTIFFWILFVIIAVTALRIYRAQFIYNIQDWDTFSRRALITRLDSIMFGFLGAYLYYYEHPIWQKKNTLFVIGILLMIVSTLYSLIYGFGFYSKYIYLSVQGTFVLFLLPKLNSIRTGKGVICNVVTFVSIISYSMYLLNGTPFHEIVIPLLRKIGLPDAPLLLYDWIRYFAFMVWTFGASWLLYKYVEIPFMNLRNKTAE